MISGAAICGAVGGISGAVMGATCPATFGSKVGGKNGAIITSIISIPVLPILAGVGGIVFSVIGAVEGAKLEKQKFNQKEINSTDWQNQPSTNGYQPSLPQM